MCNWKSTDYYYPLSEQVRDWVCGRVGINLDRLTRGDTAWLGFLAGAAMGALATFYGVEAAIGGALFWI